MQGAGMEKHTRCLVCGTGNLRPLAGYYERHGLVQCGACQFVFMERIPTKAELDAHYAVYAYGGEAELGAETRASYGKLLDGFEGYRKTNRILDVGCGRGWFLNEAKKRGWEVYGTEFSPTAVALCEANGIKMQMGVLDPDAFGSKDFDVITSIEVIEHINNPHEELEKIASLLRRGGLFYCTTPNFNSAMRYYLKADYNVIEYPEHLSYYTKSTLTRVVEQHGLKLKEFRSTGLSLARLRASQGEQVPQEGPKVNADDKLREQISRKWYLALAKRLVNAVLTATNTGLTLKGYYVKQ